MNLPLILNLLVFVALLLGLAQTRRTNWSLAKKVLFALVLGVLFGTALHTIYGDGNPVLKASIGWFDLVGNGYVQLLQMIVIPLVFASILSAVARLHNAASLGIYLLPNLFTTANLFAGFYSIINSMSAQSALAAGDAAGASKYFGFAAIAIFVAMVLDGLDGRVARMTNTQSAFGAEYDSLSDMVAFGVAPALLAFAWALGDMGKVGWMVAFIYVAGAALRLARFNTQVGTADKRYFIGLASPAAAGVVAGIVWAFSDYGIQGSKMSFLVALMVAAAGMLMVSNIKYNSFKELDLKGRVPFVAILAVVLVFAVVFSDPPRILLLAFLVYAASGPVQYLLHLRRDKTLP